MEPAPVLVRALEVEVGRERGVLGMRALMLRTALRPAHHGLVRRARIEPYVERVGELAVAPLVDAEVLAGRLEPRLDAAPGDHARRELEERGRVRVQFVGLAVDEERERHAPLPLTRQRPVRAMRDHPVQARLAPRRKELRALDAFERGLAQRSRGFRPPVAGNLVHAGEPLRGRAVDDRRPVPPAVHVAVARTSRRACSAPDSRSLSTTFGFASQIFRPPKKGRRRRRTDRRPAPGFSIVVVLHPVAPARQEIVHAVRRRAVDDAGALLERHVLAEVDGRGAVVERVAEGDRARALRRFAVATARPCELPAREARLDATRSGGDDEVPGAASRRARRRTVRVRDSAPGSPGIVQGVVVQITAAIGPSGALCEPEGASRASRSPRHRRAGTRRRSRCPGGPRTRPRLRRARCRSRSTS
jgi:hypothetical protein